MKLSSILSILADAKLPAVSAEQLQQLVGTAQGKAFADDLTSYAAGDTARRDALAAVVHALAPQVRQTVEQMGLRFDLCMMIAAAKRDGDYLFETLQVAAHTVVERAQALGYLRGIGLSLASSSPATPPRKAVTEPPYYSFKIFGGTGALCLSEARTRGSNRHTVQIEGAVLLGSGNVKEFDWRNKIVIQLTVQEAYLALALFEKFIPSVKFDGHGAAHDKSLNMVLQESHYFVRMIQRGRAAVAVPVRAADAIPVVALLYKQLMRNEPHLRMDDLRGIVQRMAQLANVSQ